ncbi:MAG: MBL fold metallo-hydrolase [Brevinema sp.]
MEITLWGVRGSMPTPEADKIKTGGNTTCLEIRLNDGSIVIIDAGTGLIPLGKKLINEFKGKTFPKIYMILTHIHWDHIYGFPFFGLNFMPGVEIDIYGPVQQNMSLRDSLVGSMDFQYCPIKFAQLPSTINFTEIAEGRHTFIPNINLEVSSHIHPGGAYSYRIEGDGKVFVFNTDVEHYHSRLDPRVVEISKGADLMIHDAQYKQQELVNYAGWGHSSWEQAVAVSKEAQVKVLGLTHHDTSRTDEQVDVLEQEVKVAFNNSVYCREGMTFVLNQGEDVLVKFKGTVNVFPDLKG